MSLPETLLTNAAALAVLAAAAWLIGLRIKRPALMHVIWLLVLMRALAPPLVDWPILPSSLNYPASLEPARTLEALPAASGSGAPERHKGQAILPAPERPTESTSTSWSLSFWDWLLTFWLAGSLCFLALSLVRAWRFESLLRNGRPATQDIRELGTLIGKRLGVRCPPIKLVEAAVSPLLWYRPGLLLLVIPHRLLARLSKTETELLLAHELAHLKRRDHLVRMLELIATVIFWWYPVLRWIRWQLRRKEEECCDLEVVNGFPKEQSAYARMLVKVAEFLAAARTREPQFSCGVGLTSLQERIRQIMSRNQNEKTASRWQKVAFAAACGWALVLFPTTANGIETAAAVPLQEAAPTEALRQLQAKANQLEQELRDIRRKQMALEIDRVRAQHEAEMLQLSKEIERLSDEGKTEEAEWLSRHRELMERRLDLQSQEMYLQRELELRESELSSQRQSLELELADAHVREDQKRAEEVELEAWRLQSSMAESQREVAEQRMQLRTAMLELEAERGRLEAERVRMKGDPEHAELLEKELRLMEARRGLEVKAEQTEHRLNNLRMLGEELKQSVHQVQRLRELGELDEAEKLERRIQELRRRLEEKP